LRKSIRFDNIGISQAQIHRVPRVENHGGEKMHTAQHIKILHKKKKKKKKKKKTCEARPTSNPYETTPRQFFPDRDAPGEESRAHNKIYTHSYNQWPPRAFSTAKPADFRDYFQIIYEKNRKKKKKTQLRIRRRRKCKKKKKKRKKKRKRKKAARRAQDLFGAIPNPCTEHSFLS
jgi:hypothetical protein